MNQSPLLISPDLSREEYQHLTPARADWEFLHFAARHLLPGSRWEFDTGEHELVVVLLGGVCSVQSNRGRWPLIGRRPDVFHGMPYCLYLPRRTHFTLEALEQGVEIAYAWCPASEDHPAHLVTPAEVEIEIRGGGNATRQINRMLPPGFDCQHLVAVEVFTPSGNWSSYPPHKHDTHRIDAEGCLLEADLEEVYFYQIDRPEGYAYQHVYSADGRLDELILARHQQLVLVPYGYHPVVAAHGYTAYYLNFLAGSAQSLASSDDPQYAWVKSTWTEKDPRLPLVSMAMETTT